VINVARSFVRVKSNTNLEDLLLEVPGDLILEVPADLILKVLKRYNTIILAYTVPPRHTSNCNIEHNIFLEKIRHKHR